MITLDKILNNLTVTQVTGDVIGKEIKKISVDSRNVDNKTLFIAIKGFNFDAHTVLDEVINKGVIAVVIEDDALPEEVYKHSNVVKILVKNSRLALAKISNIFYGKPSEKLNLIGITGTKGKSSSAFFLRNILNEDNRTSGLIGTIKNIIGEREIPTKLTTPESYTINELLSEMVKEEVRDCVMEVSSHALSLYRVADLDFNIASFTNLASDHLDFYKTRENYFQAKKILFDSLSESSFALINADDEFSERIITDCKAKVVRFGFSEKADFRISNLDYDFSGTRFSIHYSGKEYLLETKLIGTFNAYNATLAFAAAILSGVNENAAIQGIKTMPQVPGRFEVIKHNNKTVIIDYAHTTGSLAEALKALRKIAGEKRKVFTIFGAGGDRDKTKRPEMGKVAEELSDKIFVTSDNPRTENPETIIADIISGLKKKDVYINPNREEAIKSALKEADENTVVLIAGKGHENYQEVNGVRSHFSDKEIAEKYLN